jgi:hypothetical protein
VSEASPECDSLPNLDQADKDVDRQTKSPRAPRQYGGWTPKTIKSMEALLKKHPPIAFATFKYPRDHAPRDGRTLEKDLRKLDKQILNACTRSGYLSTWCLFIEQGQRAGYHFHVWFAAWPPKPLITALERLWIKGCSLADNSRKVFDFSGRVRDPAGMAAYLAKTKKAGWLVKRQFDVWGEWGKWKPFRAHCRGATVNKIKVTGSRKKVTRSTSECFIEGANSAAKNRANSLPMADPSAIDQSTRVDAVQLLHWGEGGVGGTKQSHVAGRPYTEAVARWTAVGVRIGPRYGHGDSLIPPDKEWTVRHIGRLAGRWRVERVDEAGLAWPTESVEIYFLIPAGAVRAFELEAAPTEGFAHIFRN